MKNVVFLCMYVLDICPHSYSYKSESAHLYVYAKRLEIFNDFYSSSDGLDI